MTKTLKTIKRLPLIIAGLAMGLGVFISVDGFRSKKSSETEAYYTPSTHYEVSDTTAELNSYYSSISSSDTGTSLLTKLQSLNSSKRKKTVGYSTMGTSASSSPYIYTDYVLNSSNTDSNGQRYGTAIASFYTKTSSTSFNKEHVWPNSHGGENVEADILHTRPTISSENSSRGNSFYVEGLNSGTNGWDPYTAGYDIACRGECARIILYSVVAYSGFSLSDANYHSTSNANPDNMMGNMNTLIKWHFDHAPNEYEINRNNGAEYLQGNRNPFVDHPEYVAKIWSSYNTTVSNLCTQNASTYTDWTPGSYCSYGTNEVVGSTGVSISKTSVSVAVSGTTTLSATSSDSSNITWTTSSSSVATVSPSTSTSGANVTITGVAEGTATVTAKATIGNTLYQKTCTVTVSAAGGSGIVTSNSSLLNGDNVVITTDQSQQTVTGVTGWNNNKDATVSTTSSEWKQFTVGSASSSGFTLKDSSANSYIASPSGNEFKYNSSAGTVSVDSEGHCICNSRYLCINGSNYRFYGSIGSYTPFFIYKVNSSSSKTLSSISASGQTTSFTVGDTFSFGGTVTATYSDSSTANVTSSATFSGYNMNTTGTQTVTVSYTYNGTTKTTTYTITVDAAAKSLSSISVSGQTTSFTVGDTFSFGGTVTATYSDSSTANVTSSATFSGYNMNTAGNQTVTVSYTYSGTTKTTTYSITVNSSGGGQTETGSQRIVSKSDSSYFETGSIYPTGSEDSASAICDAFNVSWLKNSGTNAIVYTYDQIRIYGGHSFMITPQTGYTLTSVVITANNDSYATAVGGSSLTNCTKEVSSSTVTLTPTNGASAVGFTNSAQSRLNYIVVNYSYESSGASPTSITASVSKTFYVGETISSSDITVETNLGNTVTSFTFSNDGYQFSYADAASGGASTSKTFTNAITYNSLTCSLTVNVQRKAYVSPSSAVTLSHTGAEFAAAGLADAYTTGQTAVVDDITFTVDGYIYNNQLSLSSSKTSAPGKVQNTVAYPAGITGVTVTGASPDIQLSTNGSTWVNLSSANTSSTNYYYLKVYYSNTTQTSYINISKIDVTVKAHETAENVANYIMYADTTNQCTSKLTTAMGYFQNLPAIYKNKFHDSNDYVISTARTRLEAWAANQGKVINYTNGTLSNGSNVLETVGIKNNTAIIVIIVSLLGVGAVGGYFFVRRKTKVE